MRRKKRVRKRQNSDGEDGSRTFLILRLLLEKVRDLSWGLGTHKLVPVDVQDRCKSSIEQILTWATELFDSDELAFFEDFAEQSI